MFTKGFRTCNISYPGYPRCAARPLQEVQLLVVNERAEDQEEHEKSLALVRGSVDSKRQPLRFVCVGVQAVQGRPTGQHADA